MARIKEREFLDRENIDRQNQQLKIEFENTIKDLHERILKYAEEVGETKKSMKKHEECCVVVGLDPQES